MLTFRPDPRYQQFWRLFRSGRFHAAHETLEGLWTETAGADRDFYQGLIQVAVSLHHLGEGNMHGADKLARTAREKLQPFGKVHRGVQLESLLLGLASCLDEARAEAGPEGRLDSPRLRVPRVDLAFGLDPGSLSD